MIDWKKIVCWSLLILFIFGFWIFIASKIFQGCNKTTTVSETGTLIIPSDAVKENLDIANKEDTTKHWYSPVVYKQSPPGIIYEQNLNKLHDTVYIAELKKLNLMQRVEMKNGHLKIWTFNQTDTMLREFDIENVGKNFTVIAKPGQEIFVESQIWYWNGLAVLGGYNLQLHKDVKLKDGNPYLGLKSGINYKEIINLEAFLNYDFYNKEPNIRTELSYKFLK